MNTFPKVRIWSIEKTDSFWQSETKKRYNSQTIKRYKKYFPQLNLVEWNMSAKGHCLSLNLLYLIYTSNGKLDSGVSRVNRECL